MARTVNLTWVLSALLVTAAFGGAVGYFIGSWRRVETAQNSVQSRNANEAAPSPNVTPEPTAAETVSPTPALSPSIEPTPSPQITPSAQNPAPSPEMNQSATGGSNKLLIPVVGVKKTGLQDTFTAARSGGRVHDANDIMAPCGTAVVAAVDGEIARFFDSVPGGITIYQRSADKRLMYYYAHLQRRAEGVQPGQFVRQGTVIGYVGDTGNSGAGNCHLHFAIWTIDDPKRDWDGTNINPYPLLKDGIESGAK